VTFDIFLRLKEETADAHRQVEERVPVFRLGFSLDDYGKLLESFYGFWAPLEAKLSQLISDMIFVEGLLQMLGNHALQTFLRRGKKLGLFLKLTVSQGAQNDGRLFLAIKGC